LRINLRTFLTIVLVVLIVLVLVLVYAYFLLTRPPGESAVETKEMKHLFSIYGYGAKPNEQFDHPNDVAFDESGKIYVTDAGHSRILVFSSKGKFLFKFGKKGTGPGEFEIPIGIAIAPDNNIYVTDKSLGRVLIFDSKGKFVKDFKVAEPLTPRFVDKKLYLTTYDQVMIFDGEGNELTKWGRRGKSKGEFDFPNGIAVGKNGNVYVADLNNLRVQAFDKRGEVIWVTGESPKDIQAEKRSFGLPVGLAIDEKELLYVVDAFHHQIKVLTTKGKQVAVLGEQGQREGEFYLPAGIAYRGDGVFAIADKYNDRVQVVRITVNI
jgi:DNA-binding beta-propeller fold protein YncE